LYFYGARWYDGGLGRFIQADTIVPGAGSSQAWDRYAYALNNPLRYIDPTGHMCSDPEAPRKRCDSGKNKNYYGYTGGSKKPTKSQVQAPSLKPIYNLSSPFYNENATNGFFYDSETIPVSQYSTEYSYNYDPLGNKIELPFSDPVVAVIQGISLLRDFLAPLAPPQTSTVEGTLYYSVYDEGNIEFSGLWITNNTSEAVQINKLTLALTDNSSPIIQTSYTEIVINSIVSPGQFGSFNLPSENKFSINDTINAQVKMYTYTQFGRLPYYLIFP
jgi:hypothetical protein